MDPQGNLKQQRELAREIGKVWDDSNADGTLTQAQQEYLSEKARQLAELVQALDAWMRKGGFSPWA